MLSIRLLSALSVFLLPFSALAEDTGFFAGLDLSGGMAHGSSKTTDGGAPIAGGGVVGNVKFRETIGVGGHAGYRFDPALSGFLSYKHIRGDVGWTARFPLFGVSSDFKGTAISDVFLANLAYDFRLSDRASIQVSAGAGLSFNTLSKVVETDVATGVFVSDVEKHRRISPAAQIGAGVQHKITPNATLGLNASLGYTGSFETGDTRSGNLGVTSIGPYKLDDVWRADLGVSLRVQF